MMNLPNPAVFVAVLLLPCLVAPSSASATSNGSCNSGDACSFQNTNYGGSVFDESAASVSNFSVRVYFNTSTSPNDRTSSLRNLRSLGATRHHITRQIALEASITGTIARTWTPTIDPAVLLAAPAIGTITGAIAGLAPAIKAAHTPPADTLRG